MLVTVTEGGRHSANEGVSKKPTRKAILTMAFSQKRRTRDFFVSI